MHLYVVLRKEESALAFVHACQANLTQNGEPINLRSSTTTLVAFPTVNGIGRAKVREEPPAVPEFCRINL